MSSDRLNLKILSISLVVCVLLITAVFCIVRPQMHKPFEISIIKHIIKINANGDTTVTKQITTTKVREK